MKTMKNVEWNEERPLLEDQVECNEHKPEHEKGSQVTAIVDLVTAIVDIVTTIVDIVTAIVDIINKRHLTSLWTIGPLCIRRSMLIFRLMETFSYLITLFVISLVKRKLEATNGKWEGGRFNKARRQRTAICSFPVINFTVSLDERIQLIGYT
uniref:Uncharacterized protein n=1 Tax=Glossina brevipalpis TaxID=37001 RepID=A0A1A9WWW6_9MUSC